MHFVSGTKPRLQRFMGPDGLPFISIPINLSRIPLESNNNGALPAWNLNHGTMPLQMRDKLIGGYGMGGFFEIQVYDFLRDN